jgi:hypothetical protein
MVVTRERGDIPNCWPIGANVGMLKIIPDPDGALLKAWLSAMKKLELHRLDRLV